MRKLRSALPAVIAGLIAGLVCGGGAVAAISIPNHSIGWNKLTPKLQKRISDKPRPAGPKRMVPLIPGPVGPQGKQGEKGETGSQGPPGSIEARCELVEGDCLIYSEEFWRLQAALEPFETETGVYPEPPFCMKAAMEGEANFCEQVVSYLYPDGTLGDAPWVRDLDEPKGWRLF